MQVMLVTKHFCFCMTWTNLISKFDLDSLENDEYVSEFWFEKKDVYILGETLDIPESIICCNGTKVDGIESLCIFLKRFAYPCRYLDMISRLGRPVPELCLLSNHVIVSLCMTDWNICSKQRISSGLRLLIFNFSRIQFMQVDHRLIIVGASLMEVFARFVGLERINAYCTIATKKTTHLSSSQLLLRMV